MTSTIPAATRSRNYLRGKLAGALLREWRTRRGFSQLNFALRAGISQRHLSFVESGRAVPSRELILELVEALDAPLRSRNEILLAAGYAPQYPERPLNDAAMRAVQHALDCALAHHEPYPAVVLDASWNIVAQNRAAQRIVERCIDAKAVARLSKGSQLNFLRMICTPDGLRPHILSWPRTGAALLARLRREATAYPGCPSERLLHELIDLFPPFEPSDEPLDPVIPLELDLDGRRLKLFNMVTTFGTPQDVTLQELRIEMSFPADESSEKFLREWSERAP